MVPYRTPFMAPFMVPSMTPFMVPSMALYQTPSIVPYQTPFMVLYRTLFIVPYQTPFMAPFMVPFMVPSMASSIALYQTPFMVPYQTPFMSKQRARAMIVLVEWYCRCVCVLSTCRREPICSRGLPRLSHRHLIPTSALDQLTCLGMRMQPHDSVEIVISGRELLQSSSLSAATATARISIVSCWRRVYVKVADEVGSRFWWKVALVKKDDFEGHLRRSFCRFRPFS